METLTKDDLMKRENEIIARINSGAVFIHPTDTIYGLSCLAADKKAVERLREIKQRPDKPFSIWVPSTNWIKDNCLINDNAMEWIQKLPGPYTLITKLKEEKVISKLVNPKTEFIGVRFPDHWFNNIVRKINGPIVTTSVNLNGEEFMTSLDNLDESIKQKVDFIIYEGEKSGRPSKVVNLFSKEIIKR